MARPHGSKNKRTRTVQETLDRLNCNPIEGTARMAQGDVPCAMCEGTGKTKHKRPRACSYCDGQGREFVPLELRASMMRSLMPYYAPKLKSIEHVGAGGGPIQMRHSGVLQVPGLLDPEEWEKQAAAASPDAEAGE